MSKPTHEGFSKSSADLKREEAARHNRRRAVLKLLDSVIPEMLFSNSIEGNELATQRENGRRVLAAAIINCQDAGLTVLPGTPHVAEGTEPYYMHPGMITEGWYWAQNVVITKADGHSVQEELDKPKLVEVVLAAHAAGVDKALWVFQAGDNGLHPLSEFKFICKVEAPAGYEEKD